MDLLWFTNHGGRESSLFVGGYWVGFKCSENVCNQQIIVLKNTVNAMLSSLKWNKHNNTEIDGKIPTQPFREQFKLTMTAPNTVRDGTPNAGCEISFDIFWKTIDPHRISQSFLGVWEGSLENVLTTTITGLRDCRRDFWNLALERSLSTFVFVLSEFYIFPYVLKIITCKGRVVQREKRTTIQN